MHREDRRIVCEKSLYNGYRTNFIICLVLVVICIIFVDRPLSTCMHYLSVDLPLFGQDIRYRGRDLPLNIYTIMIGPSQLVGRIAAYFLAPLLIALACIGYRKRLIKVLLCACLAVQTSMEIKEQLKWFFGRLWAESWLGSNRSWIHDGAFGFYFMHGGLAYESFPSGHMVAITTATSFICLEYPILRRYCNVLEAVVVFGLLGGDYHFLSDIVAGYYLGTTTGTVVARALVAI